MSASKVTPTEFESAWSDFESTMTRIHSDLHRESFLQAIADGDYHDEAQAHIAECPVCSLGNAIHYSRIDPSISGSETKTPFAACFSALVAMGIGKIALTPLVSGERLSWMLLVAIALGIRIGRTQATRELLDEKFSTGAGA